LISGTTKRNKNLAIKIKKSFGEKKKVITFAPAKKKR
jgi:hypothetical protein